MRLPWQALSEGEVVLDDPIYGDDYSGGQGYSEGELDTLQALNNYRDALLGKFELYWRSINFRISELIKCVSSGGA